MRYKSLQRSKAKKIKIIFHKLILMCKLTFKTIDINGPDRTDKNIEQADNPNIRNFIELNYAIK